MTKEEFKNSFEQLVEAFNPSQPERKSDIYFQELHLIPNYVFREMVRRAIRNQDRWPTIAKLLEIKQAIEPQGPDKLVKQECEECDGYGWAFIDSNAYRSFCEHSKHLSKSIPLAPGSYSSKEKGHDLVKTLKGLLAFTNGDLSEKELSRHIEPIQRIAKKVMTALGPIKVEEIKKEWEKKVGNRSFSFLTRKSTFTRVIPPKNQSIDDNPF